MEPNESLLRTFADNQALFDAVKTAILKQFETPTAWTQIDGPLGTSDEVLGQFLRARITGVTAVEDAFREIARYRTVQTKEISINPAR